jgi:murein L,D-transpeptidase YafK
MLSLPVAGIYYFMPEPVLPPGTRIDKLLVIKSRRKMIALTEGRIIKEYHVSIGRGAEGRKVAEGDERTPEGHYTICDKNPNSGYFKNLGVSYPNKEDIAHAKKAGVQPGGNIKIHGLRNSFGFIGKFHRWFDWTLGCIAVTNREMDELYNAVEPGTPIEIKP